jgi:hypothetical protein
MDLGPLTTKDTQAKVAAIIDDTFDSRPMPSGNITQREVNSRVTLARELFRVLWADFKWSEQRILDHLPAFIVRGLDGEEPIPEWVKVEGDSGAATWGVEAAGRVEKERRLSALAKTGDAPTTDAPLIIMPGGRDDGSR